MMTPQPWWLTDTYDEKIPVPVGQLEPHAGPKGIALVRTWADGTTDPGWGLQSKDGKPAFMEKYTKGAFRMSPVLFGYEQRRHAFAFIMRSMKVVCIDIDGKNGGLDHVGQLGLLTPTLAETSKSGDGYHLFYTVSDDEWDEDKGFALLQDRIGLVQGVDFRGTGCVYHYQSQRWNKRVIAELPPGLKGRLLQHTQAKVAASAAIVKILESEDQEEVLIMQHELLKDLQAPIPAGRRNNTLFAIGQQMKLAQIPNWEDHLHARALDLGLDKDEANKLVANVTKYQ
jgi:hypothetical protein